MGKNLVIALALLATGFFAAYLRFRPHLGNESVWTDGEQRFPSTVDEEIRYAVWDDALPLPPVVNSDDAETRPTTSPDGLYLVFVAGKPGLNRDLYISELIDGEPGPPRPLSLLNSPADDIAPAFARDLLYFASDRGEGKGGFDLYSSRYERGAFALPQALGESINTSADECDPAGVPGSLALAFASNRGQAGYSNFDLYLATPASDPSQDGFAYRVTPISPVNTVFDEREPAFTSDGITLLFASDREESLGGFDLYRSLKERGEFLPPAPLIGVNTAASERAPMPGQDGFSLMFAAGDATGDFDLYRARSLELFRVPGRPVGWIDLLILLSLLLVALLAWLAKRWETLDIIYKCFLVALLIHVLLLWYFQRVMVESDPVELPGRDALFHVSIASSGADRSAQQERNGSLESAREAAPAGQPDRFQAQVEPGRPDHAPSLALQRAMRPEDSAPGKAEEQASPARAVQRSEVAFEDRGEEVQTIKGALEELVLNTTVGAASPSPSAAAPPRRADAGAMAPGPADLRSPTPARTSLPRTARLESDLDGAPQRMGEAEPLLDSGRKSPVTRVMDGETFAAKVDVAAGETDADQPLPSVARATPSRGTAEQRPSARLEPLASDLLEGGLDAELEKIQPGNPGKLDLPRRGAELVSLAPVMDSWAGQPARGKPAPQGVALNDRNREAARRGLGEAADSDSLAQLTPTTGPSGRRRGETRTGPTRIPLEFSSPDLPAPGAMRPLALARREAPEIELKLPGKLEHTPYKNRFGTEKQKAIELHGGSKETEHAVALRLKYLASRQNSSGFWGREEDYEEKYGYVCIGKSALCLLAFLGAGHAPDSNTRFSDVTEKAVRFLLDVQDEQTGHFGWTSAYSHGIATYALAECYAITKDKRLLAPLEKAVAEIVRRQHRSRNRNNAGGWGYFNPDGNHFDSYARVSVSSWQIMALESARLGGIPVADEVFTRAREFLQNAYDPRRGYFRYNHDPSRLSSDYRTLPASTPAALFALSLVGDDITGSEFKEPRDYVLKRAPAQYRCRSEREFVLNADGNLYFWYYASLAMFRCGGQEWQAWNQAMKRTLLPAQQADGSWRPISPYAERAKDTNRDRSYSTAMCVLSLEVYYRYFTPLLKVK